MDNLAICEISTRAVDKIVTVINFAHDHFCYHFGWNVYSNMHSISFQSNDWQAVGKYTLYNPFLLKKYICVDIGKLWNKSSLIKEGLEILSGALKMRFSF